MRTRCAGWVWTAIVVAGLSIAEIATPQEASDPFASLTDAARAEDPTELDRAHAEIARRLATAEERRRLTAATFDLVNRERSTERIAAHASGSAADVPALAAAAIASARMRMEDADRAVALAFGGDPVLLEETRGYVVLWVAGTLQQGGRSADLAALVDRVDLAAVSEWEQAWLLLLRGQAHADLGDYATARADSDSAAAIVKNVADEQLVTNLGVLRSSIAVELGDPQTCLAVTGELLARPTTSTDPSFHGRLMFNRGLALEALGSREDALNALEQALADGQRAKDAAEVRKLNVHVARVSRELGRLDHARENYLAVRGDPDAPLVARAGALEGLALVDLARRDLDSAARRAADAVREYRALPDSSALVTRNGELSALDTQLKVAIARDDSETAIAIVEDGMESLDRVEAAGLSPSEQRGLRSRFVAWAADAQDAISLAVRAAGDDQDRIERLTQLGFEFEERFKAKALLASIARRSVPLTATTARDVLLHLTTRLGKDELFIEFANGSSEAFAYRVWRGELSRVPLGSRSSIETATRRFVDHLGEGSPLADARTIIALGADLYRQILAPALGARDGDSPDRIVVCPNASLATVPFHALVTDAPADDARPIATARFVIDRHHVTYAPSAATWAALAAIPPRPLENALVLAAPGKARSDPAAPIDLATLSDLPHAREEADAIERVLPLDPDEKRIFRGADATVDAFLEHAPSARLIALLCHGIASSIDPSRTGLVLAASPGESGWLPIARVGALDLTAELTILSGCSTADGAIVAGEGTLSMAYAFLAAGSRSVIGTLWTVDDRRTAELMARFHRARVAGRPTEDALRAAQLGLRDGKEIAPASGGTRRSPGSPVSADSNRGVEPPQSHPHYWAATIFVGAGG